MAEEPKPAATTQTSDQRIAGTLSIDPPPAGDPKPADGAAPAAAAAPDPGQKPDETPAAAAGDSSAAGDKSGEGEAAKPPDGATGDSKEFTLKPPETGSVLSAEQVGKIASFAKEHGLSEKAAQALVDRDNALLSEVLQVSKSAALTEQQEAFKKEASTWDGLVRADKEIGGERYKETVILSDRLLKNNASPRLIEILDKTGYRNHPELVRFMARVQKSMEPDQMVTSGSTRRSPPKSDSAVFYGGTTPNTEN